MGLPIAAGLGALLVGSIPFVVSRVVALLGLTYVSYQSVDLIMEPIINLIIDQANGLPTNITDMMGLLNIDVFITLVISGYVSGFLFKQFTRLILPRG